MDNPKAINATADFLAKGQDPLRLVVDFAQNHGFEGFWCFRMNDTHDAAHRPDKPYKLFPPLKEEHPEWLEVNPQGILGNKKEMTFVK